MSNSNNSNKARLRNANKYWNVSKEMKKTRRSQQLEDTLVPFYLQNTRNPDWCNIFRPTALWSCLNISAACPVGTDCPVVQAGYSEAVPDCITRFAHRCNYSTVSSKFSQVTSIFKRGGCRPSSEWLNAAFYEVHKFEMLLLHNICFHLIYAPLM